MKPIKSFIIYPFVFLVCVFIFSGCLGSIGSKISSTVQFGLKVDNFDSTLTSAGDTLQIKQVRFVYGDGSVGVNDTTSAVAGDPDTWQEFMVTQAGGNPILLFQGNPATYDSFVFSVQKAPEDNAGIDADFSGENQYSLIIDGTYNGQNFTYKSTNTFKVPFYFEPSVNVPDYNASYLFLISTDVQSWFLKSGGGFTDPRVSENHATIDGHIETSFSIETQSTMQ